MNRRVLFTLIILLGSVVLSVPLWVRSLDRPSDLAETLTVVPPTPTTVPPVTCELRVAVRDAETALPLRGAIVQIDERQGSTDERGLYVADVPYDIASSLRVLRAGYDPWQDSVVPARSEAETLSLDVYLEPNLVRGQVVGPGLVPLPDATVRFGGEKVPLDGEGRFVLRRVHVGDVVTAEHPGHLTGRERFDSHPTLHLALEPTSVIVNVHDAVIGQGVPDATVCASDDVCRVTDESGSIVLRQVVPDTSFSIRRQGYRAADVPYRGEESLDIELAPRELHGIIRDAQTGQPLTNTVLFVNDQVVPLGEGGRYHLTDLSQARTLFVKSPGHKRITIPVEPQTKASRYDALDPCLEPDDLPCADISLPRFSVRGIYASFNLVMWDKVRMLELIDLVDRSPMLNAIVVDIKGDYGYLAFESDNPIIAAVDAMASPRLPLTEFLEICRERHIYTIARMVIFKDSPLVKARPELAVRHPNGAIFYDREGMAWLDPTLEESWEYSLEITKEAIRMGFDEIQYDYLRYPSDSTSLAVVRALVYSVPSTLESRTAAIEGFVAAAKAVVDPTPAFLSADLFGYSLVIDPDHDMRIGQRLKDLAPHVDYVCPMIYPSTFEPGNLGLASPKDNPYDVVEISMGYAQARTQTAVRPWLQHYWYGRYEIAEQRRAAELATDVGWCYWNARGTYDELFFAPPRGIRP